MAQDTWSDAECLVSHVLLCMRKTKFQTGDFETPVERAGPLASPIKHGVSTLWPNPPHIADIPASCAVFLRF